MTNSSPAPVYEFGSFRLEPAERLLLRNGAPVGLKPKAFDLLVFLVERQGRLVAKQELMEALWAGTFVEEANLTYTVSILRRALGDSHEGEHFIQTVPTRGYRFIAPVRRNTDVPTREPASSATVSAVAVPGRTGRVLTISAVVAAAAIAAAAMTWWLTRPQRETTRSTDYLLTKLTTDASLTAFPALSRDGKLVAYASDRQGLGNLDIWVQQTAGGRGLRLTDDGADEYEPVFSPDGTRIAFRSNRDGGGIYVVSVLGGQPTLIAPEGRRPRFSPDGKSLAYWVGFEHCVGDTYVMPLVGGSPRKISLREQQEQTRSPVWSPDGQRLLVSTKTDFWSIPVDGGPPVKTGAYDLLRGSGLRPPDEGVPAFVPEEWTAAGNVIFSAISGDGRNVWQIAIRPETLRVDGVPRRLTFGTEEEQYASLGGDGRMVFAGLTRHSNLWLLPVDSAHAKVTGDIQAITQEARQLTRPDLSADGRIVVYQDEKSQQPSDLRLRNLLTATDSSALSSTQDRNLPALTADGSSVLFSVPPGQIYAMPTTGGVPRTICEACGSTNVYAAYSPSGDRVAYTTADAIVEIETSTGKTTRLTSRRRPGVETESTAYDMRYSPDGRWLAFHATDTVRRRIFLLDVTSAGRSNDAPWVAATTDPSDSDGRVAWSPDGGFLYFVSRRDGFGCLWAQRLDPSTKRPFGRPVAVYHLHRTAHRMSHNVGRVGVAVAEDKIIMALEELRGNAWMLQAGPAR